ncbi:MAG: alpha/beta hydrolase [Saprospiraceae bacterium]
MKKLFPLFTTMILLLTFINANAQTNSYELTFTPYKFKSAKGVEVNAELGKFTVPESRSNKDSRKITLSFIRFKSTNANPGSPIVYLAGGPGGSGIFTAKGPRFDLFMAMREFGDVIAFDQRGTGMSNSFEPCQPLHLISIEKPGNRDELISIIRNNFVHCMSLWKENGMDVTSYNNYESAEDIEDLRKALGANKVTLWGISYGTQLAFSFLKNHEKSTDKLILAALEATGDNIKLPLYVDHLLETIEMEIMKTPAAAVYPEFRKSMRDVLQKLDKEPVSTSIKDQKGNEIKVGISKFDVQVVTSFFLLKNPSDIKNIPGLYRMMANGNFQEMARMVYSLRMYCSSKDFYGMGLLMDAMTGVSEKQMNIVREQDTQSILGMTTNLPFPDLTQGLGLPDLGETYREDITSSVPGLFLSGTLDGRTFIEDATRIARKFKNVIHVIVENGGHDVFEQAPSVQALIINYMRGEDVSRRLLLNPVEFTTK